MIDLAFKAVDFLIKGLQWRSDKEKSMLTSVYQPMFETLSTVHNDYTNTFATLARSITPTSDQPILPKNAVKHAAEQLLQMRVQYAPLRLRIRAASEAFTESSLPTTEKAFAEAVLNYFPDGQLQPGGGGSGYAATTATVMVNRIYKSLERSGEERHDLPVLIQETQNQLDAKWEMVCAAFARLQLHALGR